MIVRNEQNGIAHILDQAAQFCSELIVLDTGSDDDTVNVAKGAGADVYEIRWPNSFAKARNISKDLTSNEWIIHLDGHDHLPQESIDGFKSLQNELPSFKDYDAVVTPMSITDSNHVPLLTYPRERVVRRHLQWVGDAHTVIAPKSPIYRPYAVYTAQRSGTKPKRALEVLQKKYDAGDRTRRTVFYLARETFWANRYADAIPLYNEWLKMLPVAWEKYSGLLDLAACYELTDQFDLVEETRWQAVDLMPSRAEAWAALSVGAKNAGNVERAITYLRVCKMAERPIDGFVVDKWYDKNYIDEIIAKWSSVI